MRYQATIFESLLKELPRYRFERIVARHGGDWRVRRLSCWSHFVALLYGHLSGAASLRELEAGLNSHRRLHYHLGIGPVRRSTLADANGSRDPAIFEEVFLLLLGRLKGRLRHQLGQAGEMVRLVDATVLPLPANRANWAGCWRKTTAAKAHVVYDPKLEAPVHFTIRPGAVNDVVEGKKTPLEPGAVYVFDRAYVDFAWWAAMAEQGCHFVTRLKANSRYHLIEERPVCDQAIVADRTIRLSQRLARARKNPYQGRLREVVIRDPKGRRLRLLTNLLSAPAAKIAALYKTRWQIELFFKWLKQNLRIKRFLGYSQNAVKLQIISAMIAFILLRLAKENTQKQTSMQTLKRLVSANLMHRKSWSSLFKPTNQKTKPPPNTPQTQWAFI